MKKDPEDKTWKRRLKKRIEHLYNCYNTSIVYNIILFSVPILLGIAGGLVGVLVFKFNLNDTATLFVLFITAIISFMLMLEQHRVAEAQEKSNIEQRKSNTEQHYNYAISQIESKRQGVVRIGFKNLHQLALEDKSEYKRERICDVFCDYLKAESGVQNKGISSATVQFILNLLIKKNNKIEIPFLSEWLDLSKVNFQGADLNNADLENAKFQGANLSGVQLQIVNSSGAQFQGANLERAKLQEAVLKNANLSNAHLQEANLSNAQLQGANLKESQLQYTNLSRVKFQRADLTGAQFQGTYLGFAYFQGAILSDTQFQGASLEKAQLQGANLEKAQLQGVDLQEAQLQGANLKKAQLQGADLEKAQLQGADLREAQFQGADLREAQFQGADLREAQFQEAEFKDTDFSGAYTVSNTSISGQTNLERAVARLTARSDEPTDLKNTVFGGGIRKNDFPDFKKKRKVFEKVLTDINYNDIDNFKEKMDEVENILSTNDPPNTSIPSGVITKEYPKEEAEVVIKRLNEIADDINALHKQLAGRGLTFDW